MSAVVYELDYAMLSCSSWHSYTSGGRGWKTWHHIIAGVENSAVAEHATTLLFASYEQLELVRSMTQYIQLINHIIARCEAAS